MHNRNETGRCASRERKKASKSTKVSSAKMLSNQVERYNVVNVISQANDGIKIGQLVQGDASNTYAKARKLFGEKIVKYMVAAI